MKSLAGKVAIVTGASAGIGESCVRKLIAQEAKVVLAARSPGPLDALASELGQNALAIPTDVGDRNACEKLIDAAEQHFGHIDILVNNAGFNSRGPLDEIPVHEMLTVLNVNLVGAALLTRLVLPKLKAQKSGAIVNVASLAGRVPLPDEAAYSASKFGLRAFTFALAGELDGTGVTASVVSPGPVDTGFIMTDIDHVPDLVFSQPVSTADQIAELVLQCIRDGKTERCKPAFSAKLATMGYLFPQMRRAVRPALERKGRKAKDKYRARS